MGLFNKKKFEITSQAEVGKLWNNSLDLTSCLEEHLRIGKCPYNKGIKCKECIKKEIYLKWF